MQRSVSRSLAVLLPPPSAAGGPAWHFVVRMFLYIVALVVLILLLMNRFPQALSLVVTGTAWLSAQIFRLFGEAVVLEANTFSIRGFTCTIIFECTAIYSSAILISAILAYPASARRKALGIAWGIPVITAINAIRIAVLVIIGRDYQQYLSFFHGYLWQVTLILTVVIVFVLWLSGTARDSRNE